MSDLIELVRSIRYRRVNNNLQQQIRNDLKDIEGYNKILVKVDKSNNLYKMSPNRYKQMLHKEVITHHKKAPPSSEAALNKEAELLAYKLKVEDRIEKFNIKNCFITLKDHKSDFQRNPACRLINPSKTQMGKNCSRFTRYMRYA